jgi:hypothetical protein
VNFGSHTDAVVAVGAALVNAVTPGSHQGRPYAVPSGAPLPALVTAALRTGNRPAAEPGPAGMAALVDLGAQLRPVFELAGAADIDGSARLLNELLSRFQPSPYLDGHDGQTWHLHFHGRSGDDPSGWGGGVCVGLATVLATNEAHRLGVCGAPGCDRVYVDTSRNGTRRFCSTACQNRVKVAAHRARRASA